MRLKVSLSFCCMKCFYSFATITIRELLSVFSKFREISFSRNGSEHSLFRKNNLYVIIFLISKFCANLIIVSAKKAAVHICSCLVQIFAKICKNLLSSKYFHKNGHDAGEVCLFVINLRKSQHMLKFTKIVVIFEYFRKQFSQNAKMIFAKIQKRKFSLPPILLPYLLIQNTMWCDKGEGWGSTDQYLSYRH